MLYRDETIHAAVNAAAAPGRPFTLRDARILLMGVDGAENEENDGALRAVVDMNVDEGRFVALDGKGGTLREWQTAAPRETVDDITARNIARAVRTLRDYFPVEPDMGDRVIVVSHTADVQTMAMKADDVHAVKVVSDGLTVPAWMVMVADAALDDVAEQYVKLTDDAGRMLEPMTPATRNEFARLAFGTDAGSVAAGLELLYNDRRIQDATALERMLSTAHALKDRGAVDTERLGEMVITAIDMANAAARLRDTIVAHAKLVGVLVGGESLT